MLRLGVLINPVAGLGGPSALKGSDDVAAQRAALAMGAKPRAGRRMREALDALATCAKELRILTWGGAMGADALAGVSIPVDIAGASTAPTSAADTREAVRVLAGAGIDLLLFAGGDGTARDIFDAGCIGLPILGIPAGVKMRSGVFAVTPSDAAEVVARLVRGDLVAVIDAEVRDVDEAPSRGRTVSSRHYGYLRTPGIGGYVQRVKTGGVENEALVKLEIAGCVAELLRAHDGPVFLGPGSTVASVKSVIGFEPTLLGFDVLVDGELRRRDATAWDLERLVDDRTVVILSFTAGQGFLVGRGNQQLTPAVLRRVSRDRIWVLGSRTKLASLDGAPLLVDSGDTDVDLALSGAVEIIVGYDDRLLYRIGRGP